MTKRPREQITIWKCIPILGKNKETTRESSRGVTVSSSLAKTTSVVSGETIADNPAEVNNDDNIRYSLKGRIGLMEQEAQTLGSREVLYTAALRENGIEPTFVTGLLQDADGKRVTSLMDGEKLAIQADNRSQTVKSIAERATGLTLDIAGDTLNENRNGGLRIGWQTENSPAAEAGGGDGERTALPSEERQRLFGQRAGEQAGGLG